MSPVSATSSARSIQSINRSSRSTENADHSPACESRAAEALPKCRPVGARFVPVGEEQKTYRNKKLLTWRVYGNILGPQFAYGREVRLCERSLRVSLWWCSWLWHYRSPDKHSAKSRVWSPTRRAESSLGLGSRSGT